MLPVVFLFSAGCKQATHECSQSLYYSRLNIHAASCVSKVSTGCLHSNDNDMANIESCSQTDVYEGKCKNDSFQEDFRRFDPVNVSVWRSEQSRPASLALRALIDSIQSSCTM